MLAYVIPIEHAIDVIQYDRQGIVAGVHNFDDRHDLTGVIYISYNVCTCTQYDTYFPICFLHVHT
jgi:hypothetical protein